MIRLVVVCVFVVAIHGLPTGINDEEVAPRIVGGIPAEEGQFKFMVSLRDAKGRHRCGGAIINEYWVVTAAHCIDKKKKASQVVVGALDKSGKGGQTYEILSRLPHELFLYEIGNNDIGLVRMKEPIRLTSSVQPIEIGSVGLNEDVITIGWGDGSNETLKFLSMKTTEKCTKLDVKTEICAESPDGAPCNEDSGGPLVKNGKLVGVVSRRDSRALDCYPWSSNIFTRVEAYQDWIKETQIENN